MRIFGEPRRVIDQHDAAAELPGHRGAHHSGGARADHGDVISFHGADCTCPASGPGRCQGRPSPAILSGYVDLPAARPIRRALPVPMLVLGIESSCDETGLALYDTQRGLLAHALHSQIAMHREYGGVVPEPHRATIIRRALPLLEEVMAQRHAPRRHRRDRVHAALASPARCWSARASRMRSRSPGTSRPSASTTSKATCRRRCSSTSRRRSRSSRCWCPAATRN